MKTVITSKENHIQSEIDLRFGRGCYFCLYDSETKQVDFIKNDFANLPNGAGTKAAAKIIELNAQKVISGDFGIKVKKILNKHPIQMVILDQEQKSIQEIIDLLS
mgnify:CR=1 FL=1